MKNKSLHLTTRDCLVLLGIVIVAFLVAYAINFLLSSNIEIIPSRFTNQEWLIFWSTYLTGIFALIVGYVALSHSNRYNEAAIKQHTYTIIRQESNRILEEITEEIKNQNTLFNIIDVTAALGTNDYNNIPEMKARLIASRSRLYERQIQWGLLKNLYLNADSVAVITKNYTDCWEETVLLFEDFIKLQIRLFDRIKENDNTLSIQKLQEEVLASLVSKQKSSTSDDIFLMNEIERSRLDIERTQTLIESGKLELEQIIEVIKEKIPVLISRQEIMFNASVVYLNKLHQFTFFQNLEYKDLN